MSFSEPCLSITNKNAVCASEGIFRRDALYMMDHTKSFVVNHLPLVDLEGKVIDLLRRDLATDEQIPLQAGGFGTRLRPDPGGIHATIYYPLWGCAISIAAVF